MFQTVVGCLADRVESLLQAKQHSIVSHYQKTINLHVQSLHKITQSALLDVSAVDRHLQGTAHNTYLI
jgi:hypothetical protein